MTTPSHIGQYRIVRKIGAGGMGLVYLGEHTLLGRRAAIKTLLPTVAVNREIVERFFNEARATSALSDPGVIQVFDFGYHVDGTAYIVMELLEGESLAARIDRLGAIPLGAALRLARQITGSLAVAHAHDIIHRDLKPENIFIVADTEAQGGERTKILDFGICKFGEADASLTQSGAMVGTPVYMSPEQCRGTGEVDHRSDIYAFGCLLFHMLTGRPPFTASATGELIVAHMTEEPPAPSDCHAELPPAVDAVLLRCLAKRADERYQSMAELQQVLGELYIQLGAVESVAQVAPRAVPLGQGFRSLYDGNFASRSGDSPAPDAALPWQRLSPSSLFMTSSPDDSDVRPARRSSLRAVLASVLMVGVVIGLVVTSFVVYSQRDDRAADEPGKPTIAQHSAAMPVEASGALDSEPAHPAAAATAAVRAPDGPNGAAAAQPVEPARPVDPAKPADAPAVEAKPADVPARPTQAAPAASSPVTAPAQVSASGPVTNPAAAPAASAAVTTPAQVDPPAAADSAASTEGAKPADPLRSLDTSTNPPAAERTSRTGSPDRARPSRESKKSPQGHPRAPDSPPASATEDLYDTR